MHYTSQSTLPANKYLTNQSHFCLAGVSGFPQDLKQISNDPKTGTIVFSWEKIACEHINGVLLGYEVKVYFDEHIHIQRLIESVTTYTVSPQWKPKFSRPKAISVAAINEIGVGDHSPPLKINASG